MELHERIKNIYDRVTKTQANLQRVLDDIKAWGSKPMYPRKDDQTDTLLDTSRNLVFKRLYTCAESKKLIDVIINDENFRLFFDLEPNSCPCSEDEDVDEEEEGDNESQMVKFFYFVLFALIV